MSYDCWLTPPDILDRVRSLFDGVIDFDPASNFVAQQYVKATTYCIHHDDTQNHPMVYHGNYHVDGLSVAWRGNVFCNPPYSAGNIDTFVRKGIAALDEPYVKQMIFLTNTSSDTKWYHDLLTCCDTALLWRGRIKFWKIENGQAYDKWEGQVSKAKGLGKVGNSPRYLSTMFYFGQYSDRFMDLFADKGTFVKWIPKQQRLN